MKKYSIVMYFYALFVSFISLFIYLFKVYTYTFAYSFRLVVRSAPQKKTKSLQMAGKRNVSIGSQPIQYHWLKPPGSVHCHGSTNCRCDILPNQTVHPVATWGTTSCHHHGPPKNDQNAIEIPTPAGSWASNAPLPIGWTPWMPWTSLRSPHRHAQLGP